MKYFITEAQRKSAGGTCYFEFQNGEYCDQHWLKDALCLHMHIFDDLKLYDLFSSSIRQFDYYGITAVTMHDWDRIVRAANTQGGQWQSVIEELTPWVEACLRTHKIFTICGI